MLTCKNVCPHAGEKTTVIFVTVVMVAFGQNIIFQIFQTS